MRNFTRRAAFAVVIALFALTAGCGIKPTDSMIKARDAIADAEAAGAPQSHPELYSQAKDHYNEGERQVSSLRYNLARCQYETAAEEAALAAAYARSAPTEVAECPACPEVPGACLEDLAQCNADREALRDQLANCGARTIVKTRVVRERCDEEPAAAAPGSVLMGTLLWEPPLLIEPGRTDYEIKVKYERSLLGEDSTAADQKYKILVDVVDVEPESVEVMSPMTDYAPLSDGPWSLSMNVPEGTPGPIKVKLGATLWNTVTDREQNLPPVALAVPTAAGEKAPPAETKTPKPVTAPPPKEGSSTVNLILAAVIGLILGLAIGFVVFKSKGGSSITKSPPILM